MFNQECLRHFATRNSMLIDWFGVIGLTLILAGMVLPVIAHRREVMLIACQ